MSTQKCVYKFHTVLFITAKKSRIELRQWQQKWTDVDREIF